MIRRLRGPGADDVRDIDRDIVLGRADADIAIDDPEVSRRHAVLRPVPEGVEVEDLGSRNGTFVNGEQVHEATKVAKGTRVQVGETVLEVER
jgi:pSer/pThr/pTyr-binding forkhead associated (FHA) protein